MQYKLLSAPSLDQLQDLVNQYLLADWIPTGGPLSFSRQLDLSQLLFAQALIKLGPPDPPHEKGR